MRPLPELLHECGMHLLALSEAMARCPRPLMPAHFEPRNPDLIAALDQFAYRFAKLQDTASTQLFRRFAVDVLAEPVEDAPVVDILNLLERYRLLPSAARWQEIRQMRNQISHEYALKPAELAVALELAFGMVGEMGQVVGHRAQHLVQHGRQHGIVGCDGFEQMELFGNGVHGSTSKDRSRRLQYMRTSVAY